MGLFDKLKFEKLVFKAKKEHTFSITEVREVKGDETADAVIIGTKVVSDVDPKHQGKDFDFYNQLTFDTEKKGIQPNLTMLKLLQALCAEEAEEAAEGAGADELDQYKAAVEAFVSKAGEFVGKELTVTFKAVGKNGYQNVNTIELKEAVDDVKKDAAVGEEEGF